MVVPDSLEEDSTATSSFQVDVNKFKALEIVYDFAKESTDSSDSESDSDGEIELFNGHLQDTHNPPNTASFSPRVTRSQNQIKKQKNSSGKKER